MSHEQLAEAYRELHKRLDRIEAAQKLQLMRLKIKSRLLAAYQRRLFGYLWN